ncbi:PAS domain S-box-containing protein [Mycolicibacterium rutilum]|uniref:PAS domain S-box-containing protein n=1 Tax=Mycolicibacterium rutilum TaxID=370526 RepID=A0A1H6IZT3_MYCRU|nr:SpoIIE family protein phosphatase [Mycolicibacterium rutilum]SEH52650.1 PAS domain S-box-containing protein [Mycolicibacterium rutilum]
MTEPADLYHQYERERARAERLADRDEFRGALVNSLQEGFFVVDGSGAVIEINDAFAEITGYGQADLPYPMPHPWVGDEAAAEGRRDALLRDGRLTGEIEIRHRDGRRRWVAVSINAVTGQQTGGDHSGGLYVGTIRDVTSARATTARDRAVARLATAVSVAKSVDEVLNITLEQCRESLDAQRLMAVIWPKTPGEGPAVHVAGEPAVASWDELDDDWRRTLDDARSWIPLTVTPVGAAPSAGTTRGFVTVLSGARDVVVCLEHRVPRVVSDEDRHLITALVGHLGSAMQHVRQFENARDTSLTLQRSLLAPIDLPAGFAVRYEPAVHPLEIGGDFYDVLPVAEHRIGVVVGDCVGRGLAAAAVMGQLRASTRALLLTGAGPAALLEHLDSVAELIPDAFCTTVFVAIVDTEKGTVEYSSAGHVPPILLGDDGVRALLDEACSVPLGVGRSEPRPQASHPLAPGVTLMLYTDGLVERRDEPIDTQIDRVAAVVAESRALPVEEVADTVLGKLAPDHGYDDDVALVLYRFDHAPLIIDAAATAPELTEIRHRLTDWLLDNGVVDPAASDLVLVVNEACSNSVEHAYRGRDPGRMHVLAERQGDSIRVRVTDFGSWKIPPADPGTRGRGLLLMRAVSDQVDLDGTPAGTTVDMTFQLPENVN